MPRNGAHQIWSFGPAVMDYDGNPRTSFPSFYDGIKNNPPRAALGYFDPGHYCFIAVESKLNRSRGKTAQMAFGTVLVNKVLAGGRVCSDYLTI